MKNGKRLLAMCLMVAMVFTMLPVQAFATDGQAQTVVDTGDVTVQGTNGFGTLLSKELEEAESDDESEEYEAGYSVTDLVIENGTASVTYSSLEDAIIVVALYSEDGMQMLTSATSEVSPEDTDAVLEFTDEMPEYFLASAYLMDTYDCSPLCASYDTPMYTREMQELLASTVDDYDEDRVLNLDEDKTTNFAVYAEEIVVIEPVEGQNIVSSTDDENETYVIKNADAQITSLKEGTIFVYSYGENEMLIAKVASIQLKGTTATIDGDALEIEEVFSYMKIEGNSDTSDMTVDTSTADEGITYKGLVEEGRGDAGTYAWESGGTVTAAHEYAVNVKSEGTHNGTTASVTVKGSLKLELPVTLNFYISMSRQYVEFKAVPKITASISASGSLTLAKDLGYLGVSPVPGVYIGFEPEFQFKFTAEISVSLTLSATIGFTFESGKFHNISQAPKPDFNIKAEGTIFIGVDFNPNIKIIHEKIAKAGLSALVGVEFTGTATGQLYEKQEDAILHQCKECLKIDIVFKAELAGSLEFLNWDELKFDITIGKFTIPLEKMYWSLDHNKFGIGACPYITYKVTFQLKDGKNLPAKDTEIFLCEEGESNTAAIGKTNALGTLVRYLPEDQYIVSATILGEEVERSIAVSDACLITLKQGERYDRGSLGIPEDSIVDSGNVYLDDGMYHKYQFIDLSMTWTAAKDYCESLGGHLATITSEKENAALVQKLSNITAKNCYWIGLYQNGDNTWNWVTEEPFDYSRWAPNEPNNSDNKNERYVHIFGKVYTGGSGTKNIGQWNDAANDGAGYASTYYNLINFGFICEFEFSPNAIQYEHSTSIVKHKSELHTGNFPEGAITTPVVNAIYPGDYGTEFTDDYIVKTASFKNLVPTQQYVLLALKSIEVENPLAPDNLLYIAQAAALDDGTLSFRYVQRETADASYVVACGASNKDLKDAAITFPEMTADGELQAVDPTVVYDGKTLAEGRDYVIVGTTSFNDAGTYTCSIRGIRNYTGLVECTYTVGGADLKPNAPALTVSNVASSGKIKLSWEAVEGAAKYEIYRATSKSGTYDLKKTTTNTSFTNTSTTAGKTYYYYVVAVAENGTRSDPSAIKSRTCDLAQTTVTLSNVASSGKIKISWTAVEGATKYEVYRATSKSGTYSRISTTANTSVTNTKAEAGKTYYYKVRAICDVDAAAGAYSSIKSRTCDLAQTTVTLSNVASSGKIKISWEAVEGATKYEVYRATSKDGTYSRISTTSNTSVTNTKADAGKTYYYKVRAICDVDAAAAAYSSIKSRTCDLPQPSVSIALSSKKPKVSWTKVDGAVSYKVYRATSKTGTYSLVKTTTSSYYKDTKATSGKTYYYKVVAICSNTAGNSVYSSIVSIKSK